MSVLEFFGIIGVSSAVIFVALIGVMVICLILALFFSNN